MSLEQALIENTQALQANLAVYNRLVEILTKSKGHFAEPVVKGDEDDGKGYIQTHSADAESTAGKWYPGGEAPSKEPTPTPKVEPAAPVVAKTAEPEPKKAEATTAAEVTYEQVSARLIELAKKKGRDAAIAVLGTFGVPSAKSLKPEQYADAVVAINNAIEGI